MGISEALMSVQQRINNSAVKARRNSDNIRLVAVSKTVELEKIIEAVKSGISILGENRVQEAREKISNFNNLTQDSMVKWHLIGNLQKNKAKTAVQLFDLIQSVDSQDLAEELNRHAMKAGKKQKILVQVSLSNEKTKHGILEGYLIDLLDKISNMTNLNLQGLMTIPPFFDDPEKTRPYFSRLKHIADRLVDKGYPVHELSMGMSNDFETAIAEGSTMVRVGTAIFGKRSTD